MIVALKFDVVFWQLSFRSTELFDKTACDMYVAFSSWEFGKCAACQYNTIKFMQ